MKKLFSSDQHFWLGVIFTAVFAMSAMYLAGLGFLQRLSISPLIIGVAGGMGFSALLTLPQEWSAGIRFCSKRLLRLGIILYGFRITLDGIASVGWPGFIAALLVVAVVVGLGTLVGRYLFRLDTQSSLLISSGCGICGAAAILAVEPVIRAKAYKSTVAVSVIVVFGTLSMFLYPLLYRLGILRLSAEQMALFIGATVHEVAHVVGAGGAISGDVEKYSVVVKMLRVLLLTPTIILLSCLPFCKEKPSEAEQDAAKEGRKSTQQIAIPWFALLFLLVIALHSYIPLPEPVIGSINAWSTFFLTLAMTALGLQTDFSQFAQSSKQAFLLGLFLYVILFWGGLILVRLLI